jgi:hypothetical protein
VSGIAVLFNVGYLETVSISTKEVPHAVSSLQGVCCYPRLNRQLVHNGVHIKRVPFSLWRRSKGIWQPPSPCYHPRPTAELPSAQYDSEWNTVLTSVCIYIARFGEPSALSVLVLSHDRLCGQVVEVSG